MSVTEQPRRAGPYLGDGTNKSFPFEFKVFASSDLRVVVADSDGAETELGQGYCVTLNKDQDHVPGGTVVLDSPLPVGNRLAILSNVSYDQNMVLTNQGGFYPDVLNKSADKMTILIQQLRELVGRTVSVPPTSSMSSQELIAKILEVYVLASQVLAFKETLLTVAGMKDHVEAIGVNVEAILSVANNLETLLNIYDLLPYVANAKTYAERAEAAAKAAELWAEQLKVVEEHYPAFVRALEEATKLFSSLDEVQLSVLNTAAVSHRMLTDNELQKYRSWGEYGWNLLRAVSTASVAAEAGGRNALESYYAWETSGVVRLQKLAECCLLTRRQNESAIWAYDDEIRVKNMLIRSYVEKPYLLFIVAGQSNAVGSGPSPGFEDASYCGLYWDWKDQKAKSLKPLKDPVYRSFRGSAWPSFARKMFEITGRKVIILNVAVGGAAVTNISSNSWYQDSKVTSIRRTDATREWKDLLAEIKTKNIQCELGGMLWIQGEAECARISVGTLKVSDYITGTLDVFNYFGRLANKPSIPIYMAQIGYTKTIFINPTLRLGYDAVRQAQIDICNTTTNVFMASELTASYFNADYMNDSIHYNQRGYNSLGASFARFISNHQSF